MTGYYLYLVSFLTSVGIFAVLALGLNIQWGFTGLFNVGIAGFFAVGAYTSAILTTPESSNHLGGFGLPILVGWVAAALASGVVAFLIGKVCLHLRSDYLAIGTIGIAEILRLIMKNEDWLTSGANGIDKIPSPFDGFGPVMTQSLYLALVLGVVVIVYVASEAQIRAPWGRMMRAIRDREVAAAAMGKDIDARRLEAFILGAMIMGLAGALQAHFFKFFAPESSDPMIATFLVWVMLILGGSGNNRGAILGALLVWAIWSATEFITQNLLPGEYAITAAYFRMFLIGFVLQVILILRPEGILPEPEAQIRASGDDTQEQVRHSRID